MRTAFIKQLVEEAKKNDKIFLVVGRAFLPVLIVSLKALFHILIFPVKVRLYSKMTKCISFFCSSYFC